MTAANGAIGQRESGPDLKALLALALALVSIATTAILVRAVETEVGPYATAFDRFWLTAVLLAAWNGLRADKRQLWNRRAIEPVLGQLGAAGGLLAIDLTLWAWALTQTSVANATLLANLTPLFTTLGGWLLWRSRFDNRFIAGLAVAVGGMVALGASDLQVAPDKLQGDVAALAAAAAFAGYLMVLERLPGKLESATIVFWSSVLAAVVTLPLAVAAGSDLLPTTWQAWLALLTLAAFCQIAGQCFLIYGIERLSADFVAIFLLLDPVLAALGAWVFFAETLSWSGGLAFAVVLLGIYLALSSNSAAKAAP